MCNFVPGECLAVVHATADTVRGLLSDWQLPGRVEVLPLLPEGPDLPTTPTPFDGQVFVHVTGVPQGLEVLAVSKLSAALSQLVGQRQAVVELNQFLPLAAQPAREPPAALSPGASHAAGRLRHAIRSRSAAWGGGAAAPRPVAVLDSGIAPSRLAWQRRCSARDYSGGRAGFGQAVDNDHDLLGHGTLVCRILDAALPDDVPLVSGRIAAATETGVTVMRVASAFAHVVAAENPVVVNLSLAPRDDEIVCKHCRRAVPVESFHSLILAHVFGLADRTLTVMAAGNRGQVANARHALAATQRLALVEATASDGTRAPYSNRVDSEHAAVARHFGGDGAGQRGGEPVFAALPRTFGTSFAAPFVAAAAYAYGAEYPARAAFNAGDADRVDFGRYCADVLQVAIDFESAGMPPRPVRAVESATVGAAPRPKRLRI